MSLDNFDELQAHQAHDCGRGSGDGRNDLASYQFALDWTVMSTSVMKKEKEVNYFKVVAKEHNISIHTIPYNIDLLSAGVNF